MYITQITQKGETNTANIIYGMNSQLNREIHTYAWRDGWISKSIDRQVQIFRL